MSTTYSYEVIKVDQAARCMEVVYTSPGNPTMHIGARLPFEGETLESVIAMYAPIANWEQAKKQTVAPKEGVKGTITAPAPVAPTAQEIAIEQRNFMLAMSDWSQLPDVPMDEEVRAAWVSYRQALRDITTQPGFPDAITWPVKPGAAAPI